MTTEDIKYNLKNGLSIYVDEVLEVIEQLEQQNAELVAHCESLTNDLVTLIGNSTGVCGLHLNGDIAEWSEIMDGGRCEGWLSSLSQTQKQSLAKHDEDLIYKLLYSAEKHDPSYTPDTVRFGEAYTGGSVSISFILAYANKLGEEAK